MAVGFHAVAYGVAQVQLHTFSGVEFVLHDHIPLQLHAPGDDGFPGEVGAGGFKPSEEGMIIENGVFDDLGAAVPEGVFRQGAEGIGIAKDQAGLAEGAHQVFPCGEIDGSLAAYGGIHSCQQSGRHLDKADAPEVGGGGEASQVTNHAAAQSGDEVRPGQTVFSQKVQKFQINSGIFTFFAGGKNKGNCSKTGRFQTAAQAFAVQGPDVAVADDGYGFNLSQRGDLPACLVQKAGADFDIIAFGCVYGDGGHPSTSSLRRLPSSRRAVRAWESSRARASR